MNRQELRDDEPDHQEKRRDGVRSLVHAALFLGAERQHDEVGMRAESPEILPGSAKKQRIADLQLDVAETDVHRVAVTPD